MKRVLQFGWLAILAFWFLPSLAYGQTTYYVRPDGGTATQCTGTTDAAYPGSGTNQPCAVSHPFYLLSSFPSGWHVKGGWIISGGDTVLIKQGTYAIGVGAPGAGSANCPDSSYCGLPMLPNGTAAHHTRIAGYGWNDPSACDLGKPLLKADGATNFIYREDAFNTNGTASNYTELDCLEMQGWTTGGGPYSKHAIVTCAASTPCDWGYQNFTTLAQNFFMQDLYIHGFGNDGIEIRPFNVTSTRVQVSRVGASGGAGWELDMGDSPPSGLDVGTWIFNQDTIEWAGCTEDAAFNPNNCHDDNHAGYGDGLGTANIKAQFIVNGGTYRYAMQDGFDGLHLTAGSSVTMDRVLAYGNMGNQVKLSGASTLTNSIIIGQCGSYYTTAPGNTYLCPSCSTNLDICRASGNTIALNGLNSALKIQNNFITGEGNFLIELDGSATSVTIGNNILYGTTSCLNVGGSPTACQQNQGLINLIYNPNGFTLTEDHNDYFHVNGTLSGPGDISVDPQIANYSDSGSLNANETASSPTRNAGVNSGLTTDYAGNSRPPWDIGAYVYGSGSPPLTKPNAPANLRVIVQ